MSSKFFLHFLQHAKLSNVIAKKRFWGIIFDKVNTFKNRFEKYILTSMDYYLLRENCLNNVDEH